MGVVTSQVVRADLASMPLCPFAAEIFPEPMAGRQTCRGKGCMAWTPTQAAWEEKREVWPYAEFKRGQVVVIEHGAEPKYRPKAEIDAEVEALVKAGWLPREEDAVGGVRYLYAHPLVWVRGLIERGRCGRVPVTQVR